MATAIDVARYIVAFFQEAGDPVSNLKLQKLLYYVQGWSLALDGKPAFPDRLEAWVHGPVQPSVYGTFKSYRWNPIVEAQSPVTLPDDLKSTVSSVLETYGADSGYELELRTHQEPPWLTARGGLAPDEESKSEITHDSMAQFFKSLADDAKEAE
ncbi:MAG: SocA family protein [Aeromicrobium sp.]|nr:SocA family protein [Burkholderiales bacterium]